MQTVLVDVDGTVARLHDEWYARYNQDYNDNLTEDKVISWSLHQYVKPECGKKIYDYLNDPTLYDNVKPYDDSQFVCRELKRRGYRLIFVTAGVPGAWPKLRWLTKYKFLTSDVVDEDFVCAYDKNLIRGNMLIDDRDKNVIEYPGGGILLDRPWNLATKIQNDRIQRANSWQKVLNLFDIAELGFR
jgi:5'(3')-deoxyribonucleotidase